MDQSIHFVVDVGNQFDVWLRRAYVNISVAKLIVEQGKPEHLAEAVTQFQQATEKASKALLLANGVPTRDVVGLSHDTVAAYLNLLGSAAKNQDFGDLFRQTVTPEQINSWRALIASFVKRKSQQKILNKVLREIFPTIEDETPIEQFPNPSDWHDSIRNWPAEAINMLLDIHKNVVGTFNAYLKLVVRQRTVDPRPLLRKEVSARTWAFSKDHAALPPFFNGRSLLMQQDDRRWEVVENLCERILDQAIYAEDSSKWPESINIREELESLLMNATNWLRLYLLGAVSMPHATTSRYPREVGAINSIGSQDYNERLGIVQCIHRLVRETEETILQLMKQYGVVA